MLKTSNIYIYKTDTPNQNSCRKGTYRGKRGHGCGLVVVHVVAIHYCNIKQPPPGPPTPQPGPQPISKITTLARLFRLSD